MLFDYLNPLIIPTRFFYSRQQQYGDKRTLLKKFESHQETPFQFVRDLVASQSPASQSMQNTKFYRGATG